MEQIGDTREEDEYGGTEREREGEEGSVNDMYTQTGRTTGHRKEGKTARKTKRGKLPKELD